MQATSATLCFLPRARSGDVGPRMTGLQRTADRRSHVEHLANAGPAAPAGATPRRVPLSRFNGATPTRAAIFFRFSGPSSGSSASIVRAVTGPIPGTERSRSSCSRQAGLLRMAVSMSSFALRSASSSQ